MEATQRHTFSVSFSSCPGPARRRRRPDFSTKRFWGTIPCLPAVSVDDVLGVLHRTGRLLVDPEGPYRRRILESMPRRDGLLPALVEQGCGGAGDAALPDVSSGAPRLSWELRALDCFVPWGRGETFQGGSVGAVATLLRENIFLGFRRFPRAPVCRRRNVNVLKISRQDPLFPFLFLEALLEADPRGLVAPYLAVTSWSRRNTAVESLEKRCLRRHSAFRRRGCRAGNTRRTSLRRRSFSPSARRSVSAS